MNHLTIVGLGPGAIAYLTVEALETLEKASLVVARTRHHPTVEYLTARGVKFEFYDAYYERYQTFEEVYQAICQDVLARLEKSDVVYAVPGNPAVAEHTVSALRARLAAANLTVLHGTSFLDCLMTKMALDPVRGLALINALNLDKALIDSAQTLVCIQCYDQIIASNLKLYLLRYYLDEQAVTIARAVGVPGSEDIVELPLYQLDHYKEFDHLTSVVLQPQAATRRRSFNDLLTIMQRLRSLDGCPWDRRQDHHSLIPYVLEEAYEVVEAIKLNDVFALEEELGDLLLQIVFHAQIAAENGDFRIEDVIVAIADKMIERHPHVFCDSTADDSAAVAQNWEKIKRQTRGQQTTAEVMNNYSKALPANFRAQKISDKAIKAGFTWQNHAQSIAKIEEEVNELSEAIATANQALIAEELGDLLFAVNGFAQRIALSSELVLHNATDKFIARFAEMERQLNKQQTTMSQMAFDQLMKAWQSAKNSLNN